MDEGVRRSEMTASGETAVEVAKAKPRRIEEFPEVLETARTFTFKGLVAAFVIGVLSHVAADMGIHHFRRGPELPSNSASVGSVCPEPSKPQQATVAPSVTKGEEGTNEANVVDPEAPPPSPE